MRHKVLKERTTIVCPVCGGTGNIDVNKNSRNESDELRDRIKVYARQGLTYHQIMKLEKIKSTSTIHYHLHRK